MPLSWYKYIYIVTMATYFSSCSSQVINDILLYFFNKMNAFGKSCFVWLEKVKNTCTSVWHWACCHENYVNLESQWCTWSALEHNHENQVIMWRLGLENEVFYLPDILSFKIQNNPEISVVLRFRITLNVMVRISVRIRIRILITTPILTLILP